jgi:hypothetical protein
LLVSKNSSHESTWQTNNLVPYRAKALAITLRRSLFLPFSGENPTKDTFASIHLKLGSIALFFVFIIKTIAPYAILKK